MPRRILMTGDAIGGVWNYSLQLIEALAPYGIEVTLVVMGGQPSPEQRRAAAALPNLWLIGSGLRLEWMRDCAADLLGAQELLLELEARYAPDIVHVNGYAGAAAGFAAPVVVVAHSCVPSWWRACRREPIPRCWDAYRLRLRRGLAAARCVVSPSRAFLDSFTAANGAVPRSRVIRNGRDPRRYEPHGKRPFVLAAGRLWDEAKNIGAVCQAAALLADPVLVAGEGILPDPMPPNLHLLGRLDSDELAARMAEAAVFAAPARYEPFGLAVLEAALSGCALVVGDIPTMRELWDGAACFVDPDDPDALASAIAPLLADAGAALSAGQAARGRALEYGAAEMARGYFDLYRELLAPARSTIVGEAAA
ncbi:MAG TPA: glycosyltransferase family 4 protein [Stellaceae bacterium]|jgi:glycosyltransferase involved in cell wall biosynthesis|nr:glycosyltransferase family 4 protein [Stellaceae bacterium]